MSNTNLLRVPRDTPSWRPLTVGLQSGDACLKYKILGKHRDGQAQLGSILPGHRHTTFCCYWPCGVVGDALFGWRAFRIREALVTLMTMAFGLFFSPPLLRLGLSRAYSAWIT